VSVVALHEDALHLSLAFHRSPLIRALFISAFVCVDSEIAHDVSLLQLEGPHAMILANHDRLVWRTPHSAAEVRASRASGPLECEVGQASATIPVDSVIRMALRSLLNHAVASEEQ